jgi:Putative prokaryotic signal transducing protein
MTELPGEIDFGVLIRTGINNPVAIGLAESLLQEAEVPFFAVDRNIPARQESGNFIGWWNIRVPREFEVEAREIVRSVERIR